MEIDFKRRIKLRRHQKAGEQKENPERSEDESFPQLVVMFKVVILRMVMFKVAMLNWW